MDFFRNCVTISKEKFIFIENVNKPIRLKLLFDGVTTETPAGESKIRNINFT